MGTFAAALPDLSPVAPEAVTLAPDSCFAGLRHELSDHYLALNGMPTDERRSPFEAVALLELKTELQGLVVSDPARFREQLASLNRHLTGNGEVWRDRTIRLGGDRAANRVHFPPLSAVPSQLEKCRLVLSDSDDPALFKAAVAYVLLLNCHPFCDGNGRTARVLFNYVLHQGGMPCNVYLPLYEINRRSHGGYEIALRMAEVRGEWEPFMRYLLNAIQCYRDIAG